MPVRSKGKGKGASDAGFLGPMLTGIASRSPSTSKVHRMFRDGHATEDEFRAAVGNDARELISAQQNFAFVSGGQLDWLDIMRPLATSFAGFATRSS